MLPSLSETGLWWALCGGCRRLGRSADGRSGERRSAYGRRVKQRRSAYRRQAGHRGSLCRRRIPEQWSGEQRASDYYN
jgi:hypothetical protein